MKHHNRNRKFGRNKDRRKALLISLTENLLIRGKIKTTLARAKEVRPYIEKLITRGRLNSIGSNRLTMSRFNTDKARDKILKLGRTIYAERKGGYTRITKLPNRLSDSSVMAMVELI